MEGKKDSSLGTAQPSRALLQLPDSPLQFVSAPSSSASSSLPSPTCGQDAPDTKTTQRTSSVQSKNRGGRRLLMRQPRSGSLSPGAELAFRSGEEQNGDYFSKPVVTSSITGQDACAQSVTSTCEAQDEACYVDCKERIDLLSRLPQEIRTYILCLLDDHRDVVQASKVSRAWNKHTREPHLWRTLFASHATDGWELVEEYETLWEELPRLRKRAHNLALVNESANQSSGAAALIAQSLRQLDANWLQSSAAQNQEVNQGDDTTMRLEGDDEEEDENGGGSAASDASSYTSAAENSGDLCASFTLPAISDNSLLGRPNWQLLYAARFTLNHRWHKSNLPPTPKTQDDIDLYHQRDHTQLPYPLCDLPHDYRHDVLLRSHWREKHWQENHKDYHKGWLKEKKYVPGIFYLSGHTDSVYCVRFDSRPFRLSSDVYAELRQQALAAPMYSPFESFGPGSRGRIVTGSRDKTIRIWDGDSGLCLHTLEGHTGSVLCLEYDDDILLSGSSDMTIRVWDLRAMYTGQTPTVLKTLRGHRAGVLDLAMKGRYIISCGKDWTVRVYDRDNDFELVHVFRQHSQAVNAGSLCVHDGSVKAVTASGEGAILLWDVATGQTLKRFKGHVKGLACVKFVDNVVISGSNDWTVRVWDTRTTRCLAELRGHWDLVRAICYAPGRNMVLTGGYDGAIKMYDVSAEVHPDSLLPRDDDGRELHWYQDEQVSVPPFEAHMPRIFDVQCDGTRVISCGESDRVCVRDFAAGCPLMRLFA